MDLSSFYLLHGSAEGLKSIVRSHPDPEPYHTRLERSPLDL